MKENDEKPIDEIGDVDTEESVQSESEEIVTEENEQAVLGEVDTEQSVQSEPDEVVSEVESDEKGEPSVVAVDDEPDEPDETWDGRPKKYKTVLAVFSTFLVMICLVIGIGLGVTAYVSNQLSPTEPSNEIIQFTIPSGANSTKIGTILEENGLIRNGKIFGYYLRYKNEGKSFQAGLYDMQAGMTLDEIISKLNRGDTVKIELVRFTIPEGFTVKQMADKLSEEGLIEREAFLEILEDPNQTVSTYASSIPVDANLHHRLEGYLFPETYEMKKGSSELEIIQRMAQELDRKIATLPVGWEIQLEHLGITFHEMMTIASMIEREVVVDAERAIVSGVIQNRLAINMPLQIDATVQYALGEHSDIVTFEDLKVESPYNTYEVQGIPPGPIATPGLSAIKAALYPEETDYLYYVTKKDGTHEHYFAKTYDQHLKNINLSKKN